MFFSENHEIENNKRWSFADVLQKKLLLKILENLQASCNFVKRETPAQVRVFFSENHEIENNQRWLFADILQKNCSWKFWKICRCPATFLEKRLWHRCFPVNFASFLTETFLRLPRGDCFLTLIQNYEDFKTCCER